MRYYYQNEVEKICTFLNADLSIVMNWLTENSDNNKFIEFVLISSLGQIILTLTYGKITSSTEKDKVICHVSYLGTQFKEK